MTFIDSAYSRRYTGPEILRTIPARQEIRDQLANDVETALRDGLKITVCPPPTFAPRKEAVRKPHPEAVVRNAPKGKPAFAYAHLVAEGMVALKEAMDICGFDSMVNTQVKAFSVMCDRGEGPAMAKSVTTKGGKTYRFFWPADCRAWAAAARADRAKKNDLSKLVAKHGGMAK